MRALAFATVAVLVLTPKAQAQSERLTVIVSDLHLSEASALDALVPFLAAMAERADGAGELVLNGDIFALGAVAEAEAGTKLESILVVQTLVLEAIASFARANRVVLVPGHDDAALLFPSVAARLEQRLPGVKVATRGLWISEDARILVEHGHQLAGDPYRWERWPSDAIDGKTSWGQRELDALYAKKVAEFPLVASFAGRVAGLKYALSIERQPQISNELLKLFLLEVSWQQFRRDLELEVEAPEWDLVATRAAGDALLLQSIPEDDPLYEAWRDSEVVAESLTDAELRQVCDYRAAVRRARRRMERGLTQLARVGPVVAECPRIESSRDPSFSYFWSERDARYQDRLASFAGSPDFYIHGHTHLPDRGFNVGTDQTGPHISNTGAFRRVVTPGAFEVMKEATKQSREELLRTLRPDELPECYSFVVIEPYEDEPRPGQWYWTRGDDGSWETARRCEF